MLIIKFHNDGTGGEQMGNYDVVARVNYETIYTGRVEGHHRELGWLSLVRRWIEQEKDKTI